MNQKPTTTHKQQAEALAIEMAVKRLAEQGDLAARCERLGLKNPADRDGKVHVAMFGKTLEMTPPGFDGVVKETGKPPKNADRLLALHYLLCDVPVVQEDRWITFRDFPGGAFYWQPFLSRSIQPLVGRIGNDLNLLRERVQQRFAARIESGPADALSARIQAVGNMDMLLVYRAGDDEFPASADLLFDAGFRRAFCAEDAVVLGSGVCLGLL